MAELRKVNQDKKLDPDWGSIFPDDAHVVKIFVKKPNDPNVKPYYFLLMLPPEPGQTSDVITEMIKEVCNTFLETGDHYATQELLKDDLTRFKKNRNAFPVLSYDPRFPTEYHWLRAPIHLMS